MRVMEISSDSTGSMLRANEIWTGPRSWPAFGPVEKATLPYAGFFADETARFGSFGKIELRGEVEDLVGLGFLGALQPVQLREVSSIKIRPVKWRIGMPGEKLLGLVHGGAIRPRRGRIVFGAEHDDRTRLGMVALAVAAAGRLDDGVKRSERAEGNGEIHVHTRLNELGGDEAARLACGKLFADELQLFLAMRRTEPGDWRGCGGIAPAAVLLLGWAAVAPRFGAERGLKHTVRLRGTLMRAVAPCFGARRGLGHLSVES